MNNNRSPLAEEYANATETNLDHARPDELDHADTAETQKSRPRPDRDDEHPLSVGKP